MNPAKIVMRKINASAAFKVSYFQKRRFATRTPVIAFPPSSPG
jgi:hypothetical protein